jgi:hypothetical protein
VFNISLPSVGFNRKNTVFWVSNLEFYNDIVTMCSYVCMYVFTHVHVYVPLCVHTCVQVCVHTYVACICIFVLKLTEYTKKVRVNCPLKLVYTAVQITVLCRILKV